MADNVIKAVFASGRRVKTAPLWRYDHGIRLQPIGLELPENYEMHFSNSKTGEATTMLADSTGAVIPAEYLIPGTEIYAWIYLVGDSYGRTKAEIIIPVDAKARPTDQEPTPEQQPVIEQAIDALNDAQDALEEAASHIIESGITPEEREKLAGIEDGAEVNVIEEVRYYDVLRQEYRPLHVTNKGVNLPRSEIVPENNNDVVYVDFEIDADGNVTLPPFVEPIIDAVNVHGQTVIARVKISNDSQPDFLPLIHLDGYNVRFAGFTAAEEKLDIWYDLIQHKWRTQFKELVDWDSADNSYVWANQGSENSGKVMKVGSDGVVTPQDVAGVPAGGTFGQVLFKGFGGDYVTGWGDIPKQVKIFDFTVSGNTATGPTWSEVDDLTLDYDILAVAKVDFDGQFAFLPCTLYEPPAAGHTFKIQFSGPVGDNMVYMTITSGNTENTWTYYEWNITEKIGNSLTKYQGIDNAGKFLVVGADGNVITQAVEENDSLAAFATDTASGPVASFSDGADMVPVKDLSIVMEPVQAGSGDPSPSNVRPITGWTAANVTRTGKNLFDKTDPDVRHGYAVSTTSGTLYTASSGIWSASGFMPVKGGNQYIISGDNAANDLAFYDANKVFISGTSDGSRAITAPANACYARMDYTIANEDRIQFEQSSAATAYEPYQGEAYAIPFPTEAGTVYGGTLDVTTGKLTVTHGQIASYAGESLPGEWISDRDVYAAGTAPTTGAQVVYELAEPVEYDLTPTEVSTILGENNIWADCGDSTVEYRADTKLYVDKKIAAIPSVPMWNGGSY